MAQAAIEPGAGAAAPQVTVPVGTVTEHPADSTIMTPRGIATGPDGAMWFTNNGGHSIGRITTSGVVSSFYNYFGINSPNEIITGPDGNLWFAGVGIYRMSPAGEYLGYFVGSGYINGMASGPDGAVWFTSAYSNQISRVTVGGVVTTYGAENVSSPRGLVAGPDGAMWFLNSAHSIGRIATSGAISTFTDPKIDVVADIAAGPDNALWFVNITGSVGRISTAGVVSSYTGSVVDQPTSIALGADNALWFMNGSHSIGRITTGGVITKFSNASIDSGIITPGPDGALWFSNIYTNTIGRITRFGTVSNFSGNGIRGADAVAAGPDGRLWLANQTNDTIGRLPTTGSGVNFAGKGVNNPASLTVGPDKRMWFTNPGSNSIGAITTAGVVANFAGPNVNGPGGIAAGSDGALWFTNTTGNSIGRISTTGVITSFPSASISGPKAIAAGSDGALWFTNNGSIGRISTVGAITIYYAGFGTADSIVAGPDGALWFTNYGTIGRITTAGAFTRYSDPSIIGHARQIVAGSDGALWFTDDTNKAINRITTSGRISRIAQLTHTPLGIAQGPDGAMWFTSRPPAFQVEYVGRIQALGAPTAPLKVTAKPGKSSVTVGWSAPAADGGQPVTYTATATPGGATCAWTSGPLSCAITGLAGGVTYSVSVTASNADGAGPVSQTAQATPWSGTKFHPVTPFRALDSRTPLGGFSGPLSAGLPQHLQVTGSASVPPSASAVVMNVTVTNATVGSFVSVWPAGQPQPASSSLNFGASVTRANQVIVPVGTSGRVSLANAVGSVDVVADIVGYFDDGFGDGDMLHAVTPTRVHDSRSYAETLFSGSARDVTIAGAGGSPVPAWASSVIMNVTVTDGSDHSFVSAWPSGAVKPNTSVINFGPGQTVANLAILPIGVDGQIRFENAVGSADLIVDVFGYFDDAPGARFHPVTPTRILDDRVGLGLSGPWGPHDDRVLAVGGANGVPLAASSIVANVTATNPTAGTFVSVYPSDAALPTVSNLNIGPGETAANLVVSRLSPTGGLTLHNELGSVDLVADLTGYFAAY